MTHASTFSNFEVGAAVALAIVMETSLFVLLAVSQNTAQIVAKEPPTKKEVPMEVQPILDLPLLKKGGKRIKHKLPDMWVKKPPIKRFKNVAAPSPDAKDEPPPPDEEKAPLAKEDEKPPPPDAAVAKQVDEQLETDEKVEEQNVEGEGSPDGVEEGTETDPLKAFAISQYKMKISGWFNVRFKRPTDEIPCDELKQLRASVVAQVSGSRTVSSYSIVRPSGNALFDQRVESTMAGVVSSSSELPPPPPHYPDILGTTNSVGFHVTRCD